MEYTLAQAKNKVIPFGKYKGKTVGDVFIDDPQYIKWLHEEVDADKYESLFDALDVFMEREGIKAFTKGGVIGGKRTARRF